MGISEVVSLLALAVAIVMYAQARRANVISAASADASKRAATAAERSASAAVKANEYAAQAARAADESNLHAASSAETARNQNAREAERDERERLGWKIYPNGLQRFVVENTGQETALIQELEGDSRPHLVDEDENFVDPGGTTSLRIYEEGPAVSRKIILSWSNIRGQNYQRRVLELPTSTQS